MIQKVMENILIRLENKKSTINPQNLDDDDTLNIVL